MSSRESAGGPLVDGRLRVIVCGAGGQMGRLALRAVAGAPDLALVGGVSPRHAGDDLGTLAGLAPLGRVAHAGLEEALHALEADVVVDLTTPAAVGANVDLALAAGLHCVVGTSGTTPELREGWDAACRAASLGMLVAPNFAIGALLMIRFAEQAARFFAACEIVEAHHDRKRDAPSGTAVTTAERLVAARASLDPEASPVACVEHFPGARGADLGGVRVHSVRLPGLLAHQEVMLGAPGQLLTLRHDAFSRECYMPGLLLGIRRVSGVKGLIYGLEHLLDT